MACLSAECRPLLPINKHCNVLTDTVLASRLALIRCTWFILPPNKGQPRWKHKEVIVCCKTIWNDNTENPAFQKIIPGNHHLKQQLLFNPEEALMLRQIWSIDQVTDWSDNKYSTHRYEQLNTRIDCLWDWFGAISKAVTQQSHQVEQKINQTTSLK